MEVINSILSFIGNVLSATFLQVLAIFGFIFIFGILLYFISRSTRRTFANSYNLKLDIYFTGWIGTPVHELGHAFFCIIFGHRVREVKLFAPNNTDGCLGYVNHSYDPDNFYHSVGNFFIGMGPILFGTIVIYALMYYMLPNFSEMSAILSSKELKSTGIMDLVSNFGLLFTYGWKIIGTIFSPQNFGSILFWIFLYLAFSISSHMQLSPPDLKGMLEGLITIVLLFVVVNMIAILLGFDLTGFIFRNSGFTGVLFGLFMFSLTISFICFVLTYLVLSAFHYSKYRRMLSII